MSGARFGRSIWVERGALIARGRRIGRRAVTAAWQGLCVAGLSQTVNIAVFVVAVVSLVFIALTGPFGVFLAPGIGGWVRRQADLHRSIAGRWSGVPIESPYRTGPGDAGADPWRRTKGLAADPATWRDLLFLLLDIPVGLVLGLLPVVLPVYGAEGVLGVPVLFKAIFGWWGYAATWPLHGTLDALLMVPQGVVILIGGLLLGPWLLRLHALFARWLLGPTRTAALRRRVDELAGTRGEAVDAHASELRRIERDLHDGAQARLAALGMSIGLAEELVATDPRAARDLLSEARESSVRALGELRDLVRGIHPPVLAERGLDGAVRALALAVPLMVSVDLDLPGRAEPPVESAAYFGVAEALANAVKHGRASRAWVELSYAGGRLIIVVGDDGIGGADPATGTGLRGIGRRLAAFDGTMTVTSPGGGPTIVTMELPCELSSPRT